MALCIYSANDLIATWIRKKNIAILKNFLFPATNNKDMYSLWIKIRPASMDF